MNGTPGQSAWYLAALVWAFLIIQIVWAQGGREPIGPGGVMLLTPANDEPIIIDGDPEPGGHRRYTVIFGDPVYLGPE